MGIGGIIMTKKVLAVALAFLYSIASVVVGPMIKAQSLSFEPSRIVPFFLCFLLCAVANLFVLFLMSRCRFSISGRGNKCLTGCLDKLGNSRLFLLVWTLIFVAWIPAYLVLYPGVLSYDMISQVNSAMGEITTNHHPVLHTWLIRCFMKLGDTLFSGYEYGIGLLSLLQMLVLSYALARLVLLLKKKNVPALLVMLTAFLSAIWFMNACLSVTMVKDTLHAAFLVLFACHFTEIATNPSEYIERKQNLLIFPIVSFLMCALRNNGIYIYVFCFAGLLIARLTRLKQARTFLALIVVIVLPVFAFKLYTGPVFAAFGIRPGEVREALCIPIQQLQRVTVSDAEKLTDEQMDLMSYYIDNLEWRDPYPGHAYNAFFADPAKSCFYSEHYNNDPVAFWKFYLQIGMQFPKEYMAAFLSNTLGYWYPGYYDFSYVMYENYPAETFAVPLERKSIVKLPALEKYYESVCLSNVWRETPVLRLFFVSGFSPWLLLGALILAWRKGFFTKVLPLFFPLIAQYGIMLLSPMSSFRYSWPFYLMLPLALIGIFGNMESFSREGESAEARMVEENDIDSN